ncbi:hypothetical protein SAMN04488102_10843 [Alkalibacterium subtropicum]|uniref:Uncharacterized protein n=1 Tax=Alkalibacterium subtropicum TaxID=753702 RepID=A0A1I1JKQ2_9LACT|nr:hypothetical protein [Alkalibacterium subtropicum]SFC49137.1 hypothetical protein SAMN04488102_10843 [Alkalibacterium subtropicum]
MWIMSQGKEDLVKCVAFSVAKNIGGKKKHALTGTVSNGIWGRKEIILGLYETKETALNELANIQAGIANNSKVFEMSDENLAELENNG